MSPKGAQPEHGEVSDGQATAALAPSTRWYAAGAAAWLPWSFAIGAAIGWIAVQVQPHFAPLFVFPLLIGLALASALVGGLRACSLAHAPTVFAATLLAAALAVGGQHFWSYRARLAETSVKLDKARQAFPEYSHRFTAPPPQSVFEYLRAEADEGRELFGHRVRGAGLWIWWGVESALVLFAVVLPVAWALRQPYCTRCHSWLRATRRGRVSRAVALELAGRVGLPRPKSAGDADYRLLTCRAGCSPSAFELSWEKGAETGRAWLDAESRRAVAAVLDRDRGSP